MTMSKSERQAKELLAKFNEDTEVDQFSGKEGDPVPAQSGSGKQRGQGPLPNLKLGGTSSLFARLKFLPLRGPL